MEIIGLVKLSVEVHYLLVYKLWTDQPKTVAAVLKSVLLEKAPGQQRGEAVKHTSGQVENGAEAGLQSCGTTSVDHHHLVDLFRILMGQEGTERHTNQAEQKVGYRTG